MRLQLLIGALLLGGPAHASDYLGARRCKGCHEAQYAQWKQTPHARAAAALSKAERRDPRCAGCHSTAAREGLEGVQCESCHGPGRHYWQDFIMRDVELARAIGLTSGGERGTCLRCHDQDTASILTFDFAKALLKVQHGQTPEGDAK